MYSTDKGAKIEDATQKPQEFPIVCASCFGDSPYMTMNKAELDRECKICTKPFTVFKWRAGREGRMRKTEICKTCALVKNVCQVCIHDLEFGLPVQVRDAVMSLQTDKAPVSDISQSLQNQANERLIESGQVNIHENFQPSEIVARLARTTPYHKRTAANVCSYFLRGDCNRGTTCSFKHISAEDLKQEQPGAGGIFDTDNGGGALNGDGTRTKTAPRPPADRSISTLFLANVDPDQVTESDLRSSFLSFGNIRSIKLLHDKKCAFVVFEKRDAAESAVQQLFGNLQFGDCSIKINWCKPQKPTNNKQPRNNKQQKTNENGEQQETIEGNESTSKQLEIEQPQVKPVAIKTLPTFKINPSPTLNNNNNNDNNNNNNKYSAMDPSTYGGKY
ncbi:CCCH-type zinc finger-containing protein [Cavenderia fasciculata]|uniref:CCCH-type zinc finger-containing protein n=1 Tax=Cavenderia fasciculata TaxID=261658 RepID=F4QDS7_CACFS|nr:CCCH-type zinc finger-containing protein [Cavenderia fasciculata]EGG13874.1 CCCH-type zinc finger-containing protein [Cavenderia fasciculata]|eukprot:XP_004350582.1 CCCH-type zinc finger-containing protein [Cavenderia fasciculata]